MPLNLILIEAVAKLGLYFGDDFTIEYPTGSGHQMNLREISSAIGHRVISTFLRSEGGGRDGVPQGYRPVFGGTTKFQTDPHWRDLILFYEYFHGDNGAGIGASHQTGWTGAVAIMIPAMGSLAGQRVVELLMQQASEAEMVGSSS
jgi:hypothetical protein